MSTTHPTEEGLLKWFQEEVVPKLVAEGKFTIKGAENKDLVVFKWEIETTTMQRGSDYFASVPYFIKIGIKSEKDAKISQELHIVVKFITQNIASRAAMATDVQFYNEMIFYEKLIPEFQNFLKDRTDVPENYIHSIIPVSRYCDIDLEKPDYAIIVMDDLRREGFSIAKSKIDLDYHQVKTSMKRLAQFHAMSYAMKLEKYPKFEELCKLYRECRYQDDAFKAKATGYFHEVTGCRAIDYLLSKPTEEVPKSVLLSLKEKIVANPYKIMQDMIKPKDDLSVICHGDFCRNNILFHATSNQADDCRLIDFQTWRYSSPSIDLSFFFYMNTTLELRVKHFEEFIQYYHEILIESIALITSKSIEEVSNIYTKTRIDQDFGEHALYGYLISAFFIPAMMAPKDDSENFEDEWMNKTFQEMALENAEQGGERVTRRIADILVDMYRRKYIS